MATITSPRAQSPSSTSRSGTPRIAPSISSAASSGRPSLEISRDRASSPVTVQPATNAGTTRRNRAALRDYYNLKAKPAPINTASPRTGSVASTSASAASSPTAGSPASSIAQSTITTSPTGTGTSSLTAQLDNPDFDAESYLSTLLKTKGLKEILRTEAVLVSEIRNLDGDRKALVYDNYSKLIAAVGTLGEMSRALNANTDGYDSFTSSEFGLGLVRRSTNDPQMTRNGLGNMKRLHEKMEALNVTVTAIASESTNGQNLSPQERTRNAEILAAERLQRQQARQDKKNRELVRRVIGAPSRLSELIQEGKREDAEKEWSEIKVYLDTWEKQNVQGTKEVRKACEEVMDMGDDEEDESEGEDEE